MSIFGFLRRITGFSTPFGGLSWVENRPRIPKYDGVVNLTWNDNQEFYDFLTANKGKTVGLNIVIDASVSVLSQTEIVNQSPDAFERIHNSEISDVLIPLPNDSGMTVWLIFRLLNGRRLPVSHGGTGIFQMPLKGIFDVVRTAHSGPSVQFHIAEENVDVEFRSAVFGG